jgi:hypothetical protein
MKSLNANRKKLIARAVYMAHESVKTFREERIKRPEAWWLKWPSWATPETKAMFKFYYSELRAAANDSYHTGGTHMPTLGPWLYKDVLQILD